ncbi:MULTISPECIES: type IV secretion system protein [Pseudomonas syringae group]|uniref:Conjugal transfer protein n=1 Tax=Pseudomonas syringae pv. cilantro TaxID=81035 RepID=A0A0N0XAN3_PSESX|nr:type IV secretion system protein [Pseudomonas syringae]KPC27194.1 Conjugal transfer protein [Pseudomonas syringae pv. cilantro]KPC27227.1 Conjugal transfer protein [Pseudomonas syringae pv. cilantro]
MSGDGFFVRFNSEIMDAIKVAGQATSNVYVQAVAVFISGAITFYVLWMGYQTLAGKIQTPLQDVVWNLAKIGIILAFIENTNGYLTATLDAMQGLKDGLSGNQAGGVWAKLDSIWSQTQALASAIKNLDTSKYVKIDGGVGALLVWIGSITLMLVAGFVFFAADVTMLLLGMTAPLFIFCLMFGFLRTMFNNWLQLIFSSILTVMFASLVINIGVNFMVKILTQVTAQATESNLITMGALACVAGLLTGGMVLLSAKFAMQIAGVGMEGAVQGMAAMGLGAAGWGASKTLGEGMKFGKGVGKGIAQGGDAKTKGGSEWAGKQLGRADDFAAGAYKYGGEGYKALQKMSKQAVENMKARNNNP